MTHVSCHVALTINKCLPSDSPSALCGRLIISRGNLRCVFPFPSFFELTERVDVSVGVATEVVVSCVVCCCRVRGAIPVWQDDN
jgi:hypothetical protein